MPRSVLREVGLALGFAAACVLSVIVGRSLRLPGSQVSLIWPAAAVSVLWLLHVFDRSLVSKLLHGALFTVVMFAATYVSGSSVGLAAWFSVVNLVLPIVVVRILRFGRSRARLDEPTDLARLLVAIVAGSYLAGLLATAWFAVQDADDLVTTFALFVVRNGVTAFVGVAAWLRLTQTDWRWPRLTPHQYVDNVASGLLIAATLVWLLVLEVDLPIGFLAFLPAVWVALRWTTTAATLFLLITGMGIILTALGELGVFTSGSAMERALHAQAMLGSLTVVVLALALFRDSRNTLIDELRTAQDQLLRDSDEIREARNLFAGVLDAASEQAIIGTDVNGRITVFNHGAERMLGWQAEEMLGASPMAFFDRAEVATRAEELGVPPGFEVFTAVGPGSSDVREWTYLRRDGTRLTVILATTTMIDERGRIRGHITVATDVTARKEAEEVMRRLAMLDPLTGLSNRTHLLERLDRELRKATSTTGLLFIDLDGFKSVNDHSGHAAGDHVLATVARRLTALAGPECLIARLGGDEFAVLSPTTTPEGLTPLAEQVVESLAAPYSLSDGTLAPTISASVGGAVARPGTPASALLRDADEMMYAAKRSGKNQFRLKPLPWVAQPERTQAQSGQVPQ